MLEPAPGPMVGGHLVWGEEDENKHISLHTLDTYYVSDSPVKESSTDCRSVPTPRPAAADWLCCRLVLN